MTVTVLGHPRFDRVACVSVSETEKRLLLEFKAGGPPVVLRAEEWTKFEVDCDDLPPTKGEPERSRAMKLGD
jgi:hypothetical protein